MYKRQPAVLSGAASDVPLRGTEAEAGSSYGPAEMCIRDRAIIKNSPIIVLDEATAFSDPENEYLIQKAFEKLMQGKTVIIIAHRLSTIRNADKIIVMEKGYLVEEGKHDELVAADGRYAQMWNHYTEAIGWKISGKAV